MSSSGDYFKFLHRASNNLHMFITQAISLVFTNSLQDVFLTFNTLGRYLSTSSLR